MKKETTNTFNKGMVKDLHPLTTPDNILTDALNATLITYNGNEGVLQNDMGNVKIDAELPAGYVPVGMKEHGGIIYVAAYNPETGKGQVGSFPSPKQMIKSAEWSVNNNDSNLANISISPQIYEGNSYKIKNEIIKQELFGSSDGEARVFHPGDKFIINIENKDDFTDYVNDGILDIELGVIKNDGGIETMKTWTKGMSGDFISSVNIDNPLETGYISPENALKDPDIVQVFDAPSSGKLILIITLHTIDTFNVIRNYYWEDNAIKVKFTGEAQKNGVYLNSITNSDDFQITEENYNPSSSIVKSGSNTETYSIYPVLPFGFIDRMKKNITIHFDKIKENKDDFGEWRFYVTQSYVKIGWSYDFYNLDGTKEIEYIKMYFHLLEDGYNRTKAKQVVFQRESYNGNFEDYINIQDTGLIYKNIYIVEIVKKLNDENEESIIAFKMLYLSPLYNSKYNGFYKNQSIGQQSENQSNTSLEYEPISSTTINLQLTTKYNSSLSNSKVNIKLPGGELGDDLKISDTPNYSKVITDQEFQSLQDKNYVTKIKNNYETQVTITGELKDINDNIIGQPKPGIVSSIMSGYSSNSVSKQETKEFINSTNTIVFDNIDSYEENISPTINSSDYDGNSINIKIGSGDIRLIQGISSELKHDVWKAQDIIPLYAPSYSAEWKNKLAPYWNQDNARCISGDNDDAETIFYNSTLFKDGSIGGGIDAGAGIDDAGLFAAATAMNRPMTNIFAGINGEAAELEFAGLDRRHVAANGFDFIDTDDGEEGGHFLNYQSDDYLVACWKFSDGETRFVNLATRKYWSSDSSHSFHTSSNTWPRLDVILRCLISQLFVVGWTTKQASYISPNINYYRYQDGVLKLNITLNYNNPSGLDLDDVMTSTHDGFEDASLTSILGSKWGYNNDNNTITVNGISYPMINLIPKVSIVKQNTISNIEVEISGMYNMDLAIANYLNSSYVRDASSDNNYDPKTIYTVDVSYYNGQPSATLNDTLTVHPDGTFEWITTPKVTAVTKDLRIFRWNSQTFNNSIIFTDFGKHFMTAAALNNWTTIPEQEINEVIASLDKASNASGYWTNAKNEYAPDMKYNVLFSEQISPLG